MAVRLLGRFAARLVGTVFLATLLVFVAVELSIDGGFGAVVMPLGADPNSARDRAIVEQFHLDEPLIIRHAHWLADAVRGDFGRSTRGGTPVAEIIMHRLTISLELALAGTLLAVVVGIPLGLLSAAVDGRPLGRLLASLLGLAQSVPVFMAATLLIWLFAVRLGWLAASGWTRLSDSVTGNLRSLILPAVALAIGEVGVIARVVRADVLTVLRADYITAAIGKGLSRPYILLRHALRPGSIGLLTVLSMNVSSLIGGAFVVEIVFGIGGLGQELIAASVNRDLALLLGLTSYTVAVYVVVTACVDVALVWADPRIRSRGPS